MVVPVLPRRRWAGAPLHGRRGPDIPADKVVDVPKPHPARAQARGAQRAACQHLPRAEAARDGACVDDARRERRLRVQDV